MSIADVTEFNILKLIFNATNWANVADNAAASPITTISMALHTADPGDAGTQSTSESAYAGYLRQSVNRNTSGWTVASGNPSTAALAANVDYPPSGGTATTVSNFSAGKPGGGATDIYWTGALSPPIAIGASGVIPRLNSGSTLTLD